MLTLSLSSINRRLRGPLQGLLVLSLVFGVVLSANSQALMLWQMAAQNEQVQRRLSGAGSNAYHACLPRYDADERYERRRSARFRQQQYAHRYT